MTYLSRRCDMWYEVTRILIVPTEWSSVLVTVWQLHWRILVTCGGVISSRLSLIKRTISALRPETGNILLLFNILLEVIQFDVLQKYLDLVVLLLKIIQNNPTSWYVDDWGGFSSAVSVHVGQFHGVNLCILRVFFLPHVTSYELLSSQSHEQPLVGKVRNPIFFLSPA